MHFDDIIHSLSFLPPKPTKNKGCHSVRNTFPVFFPLLTLIGTVLKFVIMHIYHYHLQLKLEFIAGLVFFYEITGLEVIKLFAVFFFQKGLSNTNAIFL